MRYRRAYYKGGCYFFTVVTAGRKPILITPDNIALLRTSFQTVQLRYPFDLDAIVILPDHLHCLWRMPPEDADFSLRWRLIKTRFSKLTAQPAPNWQLRFWEHLIRNERNYQQHADYIHYNPVKHGYVKRPADWPYSSFSRHVKAGNYPADWGTSDPNLPANIGHE